MEILSPKGHDLLRCMVDQKKKSVKHYQQFANEVVMWSTIISFVVNNYQQLPTMFETGRGGANYDTPSFGVEISG